MTDSPADATHDHVTPDDATLRRVNEWLQRIGRDPVTRAEIYAAVTVADGTAAHSMVLSSVLKGIIVEAIAICDEATVMQTSMRRDLMRIHNIVVDAYCECGGSDCARDAMASLRIIDRFAVLHTNPDDPPCVER